MLISNAEKQGGMSGNQQSGKREKAPIVFP